MFTQDEETDAITVCIKHDTKLFIELYTRLFVDTDYPNKQQYEELVRDYFTVKDGISQLLTEWLHRSKLIPEQYRVIASF
jgi:hypothetical protein